MNDDYDLTHAEATAFLGTTPDAVYRMAARGALHPERIPISEGSKKHFNMYSRSELAALKAKRDVRPYRTDLSPVDVAVAIDLYCRGYGLQYCRKFLGIGMNRMYRLLEAEGVEIRRQR